MARVQPPAPVSDWMMTTATVLPHPFKQSAPYSLGEGVAELGAYAKSTVSAGWDTARPVKANRRSLEKELDAQSARLGDQLRAHIDDVYCSVRYECDRLSLVGAAERFGEAWSSNTAIACAFDDLCDAARTASTSTLRLRQLSAVIASQIGVAALNSHSPLDRAADFLMNTEEDLVRWHGNSLPRPMSEEGRRELARKVLTSPTSGKVVVWAVYSRATAWGGRTAFGPITFFRPELVLADASAPNGADFPERAELRSLRRSQNWIDSLREKSMQSDSQFALVRVDLGERSAAGAWEEARRRIDAIVGIAVASGGASWQPTGTGTVLLDGEEQSMSFGPLQRGRVSEVDSYGMRATAEILHEAAMELGDALQHGPMPDHLIEAINSLREARMTDHRDVRFHGERRITPRIATALEDHAIELIASVLDVTSKDLASALERDYALTLADHNALRLLMSPFDERWSLDDLESRRTLEDAVSHYDQGGTRVVNIAKLVANQHNIRELRMTALQRLDFEEGLTICVDPNRERQFLEQVSQETSLLRARHRRVRNAINHGLPLASTTVGSVREYASETSRAALNIALTHFRDHTTGTTLLDEENAPWNERISRIGRGEAWATENAGTEGTETSQ